MIQAGAVGRSGEALVLDMGAPVRIDDVARRLIAEADRTIPIVYTGLRPGEKLHEVLFSQDETGDRPVSSRHLPRAGAAPLAGSGPGLHRRPR